MAGERDRVAVGKEVFGGSGSLGVVYERFGLEVGGFCELVGRPEGELGLSGSGLAGEEEGR
jgi:hypothetical protein